MALADVFDPAHDLVRAITMSSDLGTCDAARCGARAYIAAISPVSAKTIALCAHHYGKAEKKLAEARWIIEDWRQELEVTR